MICDEGDFRLRGGHARDLSKNAEGADDGHALHDAALFSKIDLKAARELVGDSAQHFACDHSIGFTRNSVDELSKTFVFLSHFTQACDFKGELLIFFKQLVVGGL